MPTYTYKCIKCENVFELFATYKNYDNIKTKCPKCSSKKTERCYDIDLRNISGSVIKSDSEIKLGHLADRNRDRMSNDEKSHLYKKHNDYKEKSIESNLPSGMSRINQKKRKKWT